MRTASALFRAVEYIKASLSTELRRRRSAACMTQESLSKKAKVRVETISRIESGKANPTLDTLFRILRALES